MSPSSDTALCYAQGKSEGEIEKFKKFFIETQRVVDAKQLRPMIRTQYMRTAFQIPFDSTVRVSLDTNLCMIKENPADGPTCHVAGRCGQNWHPVMPQVCSVTSGQAVLCAAFACRWRCWAQPLLVLNIISCTCQVVP